MERFQITASIRLPSEMATTVMAQLPNSTWSEHLSVITYRDSVEATDSTSALKRLSLQVRNVLADAGLGSLDYTV